jgi:hypothetical protein
MKHKHIFLGALTVALAGCEAADNNPFEPEFTRLDDDAISWISSGHVAIQDSYNPAVPAAYHFHAKLDKNGTKGKFEYKTFLISGELYASGEVVCMNVQELPNGVKRARFGGVITSSNRPEFPVGSGFIWNVTDDAENNESSRHLESASPLLGFPVGALEAHCRGGGYYLENPVDGHIHIHKTGQGS